MTDALFILLIRFRRRLIVVRAMRLLGMAAALMAAACMAGAVVERVGGSVLLARIISVVVIAAGLPMIVRLRHMPTVAAAALEIDSQMGLRELLSSAVQADCRGDLSGCVVIVARQRAGEVDINQLKVGSAGTPMWIAALLVTGLLPLLYRSPAATSEGGEDMVAGANTQTQRESTRAAASAGREQRRLTQAGETPGASAITIAADAEHQRSAGSVSRPTRSDVAGLSAGGGLAQGSATAPPASSITLTGTASDHGKGTVPGNGNAQTNATGADAGTGQVTATRGPIDVGRESPAVAHEHQGMVDVESFPENYRDVLKAYFAR